VNKFFLDNFNLEANKDSRFFNDQEPFLKQITLTRRKHMKKIFASFLIFVAASAGCSAAPQPKGINPAKNPKSFIRFEKKATKPNSTTPLVVKNADATPVIMIEDFSNFDGFIAMMLLQKSPEIDLRLIVANNGFGNVGPSMNNIYNMLAWLGNTTTPVVPGTYFADQEIAAGPNPGFEDFPGSNVARKGQMAQPIFNMFVPPLWKENGSTLYGTEGRIPVTTDPTRQYKSVHNSIESFIPVEEHIKIALEEIKAEGKTAIIFNTGSHSDLAKFFTAYPGQYDDVIKKVLIMGGGFFNFANPDDSDNQRWAGNIFCDQLFALNGNNSIPDLFSPTPVTGYDVNQNDWDKKPSFHTMQEFNIFLDPAAAKVVFDYLNENSEIETVVVPTDATDPILIADNLNALSCEPTTPEAQYVYSLIQGIKDFENGAFNFVIRAWDILAALTHLDPQVIDECGNIEGAKISVKQLNSICKLKRAACCKKNKNPFNVLQYDPYVGQTTLVADQCSNITVVTKIDGPLAFERTIERLKDPVNTATSDMHFAPLPEALTCP
jgi:inosine-uridine nucleoside N-ribohydrolase